MHLFAVHIDKFTINSWWRVNTYVDIRYNGQKMGRTSVCKRTTQPEWNQYFLTPINESANKHEFWFRVMQQSSVLPDVALFETKQSFERTELTDRVRIKEIPGEIFIVETSNSIRAREQHNNRRITELEEDLETSAAKLHKKLKLKLQEQTEQHESELNDRIEKLNSEWEAKIAECKSSYEAQCSELTHDVSAAVTQCRFLQGRIDKMQEERLNLMQRHSEEIAKVKRDCQQKMAQMQDEIDQNEEHQRLLVETLIHK